MLPAAPAPRLRRIRRAVAAWRPARLRRNTAFLLAGLPLQAAGPAAMAVCWLAVVLVIPAVRGAGLLTTLGVQATLGVWAIVLVAGAGPLTALQRRRCQHFAGVGIPPPATAEPLTWGELAASTRSLDTLWEAVRRLVTPAGPAATGRQVCYHLLVGPAVGMAGVAALSAAPAGLVGLGYGLGKIMLSGGGKGAAAPSMAGALALLAAPWLLAAVARLDVRAAYALLGPSQASALAHRVQALTQSRAGVVDAADAERRRIERDLHDGAQQRLVSLALNLGIARESLTGLPDDARKVIEEAHEEAKEALAELRNLVRGLHPAILEDRGLDAALSGVAALAPFPVRLRVGVRERPTPMVEAVAYFIVSEALANITKHARATRAGVEVTRMGDLLRVRVADDGVGGADPARGTGLAGLARRAASVDGSFRLSSPAGGPTEIVVELPCGP